MVTLITGITGLLGTALVKEAPADLKIKGIYIGDYSMPGSELVDYSICDITDQRVLFDTIGNKKVDCIIHAAGMADTDACEREQQKAHISNVVGTKNIIRLARLKGAKLVYISTNAIFDGEHAPYSEESDPNPINTYGKLKLECESLVKEYSANYLIVRPILMYGLNNPYERKCFFLWVMDKLTEGERIQIVNDVLENPLLSYQCAQVIWRLVYNDKMGFYHIAGKDILSRFDAAIIFARFFSLDTGLIQPVSSDFFPTIALRPKNTSYNTSKIEKELNVKPLKFIEGLQILKTYLLKQNSHTYTET